MNYLQPRLRPCGSVPLRGCVVESPSRASSRHLGPERRMGRKHTSVFEALERLESHYGPQAPSWPVDPYEFLVWWHSGYPASDAACARGWASLRARVGTDPQKILAASAQELAGALRPG